MPLGVPKTRRTKQPKPAAGPRPVRHKLAVNAMDGNNANTPEGPWRYYLAGGQPWWFRSADQRQQLLDEFGGRLADLAGHAIHLRVTSHPQLRDRWAADLTEAYPNRPPDVPGTETYAQWLAARQNHMLACSMSDPGVYLGVLTRQSVHPTNLPRLRPGAQASASLTELRERLHLLDQTVAGDGLNATRVSSRGLGWIMQASIGLGLPVDKDALPGPTARWTPAAIEALSASAYVTVEPLTGYVKVHASRSGHVFSHYVAILTVSDFEERDPLLPTTQPWIAAGNELPFGIEWSIRGELYDGRDLIQKATVRRTAAYDQVDHFVDDHAEKPEPHMVRAAADAERILDEVTDGSKDIAARFHGHVRVAVFADRPTGPDGLASRIKAVTDFYRKTQKITLTHAIADQYEQYLEFIPGEPVRLPGMMTEQPAYFLATSVPHVENRVGSPTGPLVGRVVTTAKHRPFLLDLEDAPASDLSPSILIVGDLGSGKSATAGVLTDNATELGIQSYVNDPTAMLAELAKVPRLRPRTRVLALDGSQQGILNPFTLVPQPDPDDYPKKHIDPGFVAEAATAAALRQDLTVDALTWLLPPQMLAKDDGSILLALEDAVRAAGGAHGTSPWQIVNALRGAPAAVDQETGEGRSRYGERGRVIAAALATAAALRGGRLVFPAEQDGRRVEGEHRGLYDQLLTIITMSNITPPPAGTNPAHWTRDERAAWVVLMLAAKLTSLAMYSSRAPKLIVSDETGIIATAGSAYSASKIREIRDGRKWNTTAINMSQNPKDMLLLSPEVANLAGWVFAGRMTDLESARELLKLLGVARDQGYENVLLHRLGAGRFVVRDPRRDVGIVQVDIIGEHLRKALDTTPAKRRRAAHDDLVEVSA